MTRDELTREIARRIKEIRELYYEEYPDGDYLDMTIRTNVISFNNENWDEDEEYPIYYWEKDDDEQC